MNIIAFGGRAVLGSIGAIGCAVDFAQGNKTTALASLSIVIVLFLPLLLVLYRGEKLEPASALKASFNRYVGLSWTRAFLGFSIAVGAMGNFAKDEQLAIATLPMALFLLSPLGDMVFTFSQRPYGSTATPPWTNNMTMLVIARTTGVFFVLVGTQAYLVDEPKIWHVSLPVGILLIFIRPIKRFVIGKQVTPAPALTTPLADAPQGAPAAAAPVVPAIPSPAELQKLSGKYKALLQLGPAQKGAAYEAFLNELFSLYEFSARSTFQLRDNEINGSFELDGQTYILIGKWQEAPCGYDALLSFNGKVAARSTWARGILISNAGFTQEGLEAFAQGTRTSIIGMDGKDLQLLLSGSISLPMAIKRKVRKAVEANHCFVPLQKLL